MEVPHEKSTTFLGKTNFRGSDKVFGVKLKDRRQHIYVVGKTGTGKSVLLKNMALQDIHAGRGVGIIDPHGEFVEELIAQIPPERINDVIYFNPVDSDFPIGFNVLEVPDTKYKHLVVSDLLGIFTKIWANVWSARMEYILQNCILALLDTPGTTLLGIPRILVDKEYREKIIAKVQDPVVRSFWIHEYETWRDQFRNEAIVPIQNKVGQFLNTSFVRNIVGQPTSTLNIPQVMNEKKILLVNVSKGRIGEDNSQLLGAMIITKIQLAAMERVRVAEEEREDFFLYVDEFQNFATDSFASILSEARKYRLDLTVAHQYTGQLISDTSTKVRDAVFGNVGTMIVFRVGAEDAEFLEKEFEPEFLPADIVNLPNYHIYLKLMVNGVTSRPFSAVTLPPLKFGHDPMMKEKIMRVSRERYARPRAEVEAAITRWSGFAGEDGEAKVQSQDDGKMHETVCWNCGKQTTVPFKPDGKRPVYCLECLRKIEAGTLIPIPERMPQVGARTRFADTLGALGIEFSAPEIARPFGAKSPRGQDDRIPIASTKNNFGSGTPKSRSGIAGATGLPRSQYRQVGHASKVSDNIDSGAPPFGARRPAEMPQRAGNMGGNMKMAGSRDVGGRAPSPRFAPRPLTHTGPMRHQPITLLGRSSPAGIGRGVPVAPSVKPVSLAALRAKGGLPASAEVRSVTSRDKRIPAADKIDVNDLRKSLDEALKERKVHAPVSHKRSIRGIIDRAAQKEKSSSPEELQEDGQKDKTEKKNIIKPGDRIKF